MKLALTTAAALFAASSVYAAPVTLLNDDFEDNSSGFSDIPDWDGNGGTADHAGFAAGNNGGLGTFFGFYSGGGASALQTVFQDSGVAFAADTVYTFSTFMVSGNGDITGSTAPIQIGYLDGSDVFQVLAETVVTFTNPDWAEYSVTFTTSSDLSGEGLAGETVAVRYDEALNSTGTDGKDIWIDAASLDASPVPEPGSLALLGLGGLALLRRRR